MINLEKASGFFSKNMPMEQNQAVCSSLGEMTEMKQGKYLGLPMVISRTKEQIFGFIKENIKRDSRLEEQVAEHSGQGSNA